MRRLKSALFGAAALGLLLAAPAHAQWTATGTPFPNSCVGLQTNSAGVPGCQFGVTINNQAGTTYTFALTDELAMVISGSASATTFTIPLNASVAFPVGTVIPICQGGAGKLTVAATGGVTLNFLSTLSAAMLGQYACGAIVKTATDTWTLYGGIGG